MNYRHAFHAGNFADLVKYAVLTRLLRDLAVGAAPLTVIDTHAGAGIYDLTADASASASANPDQAKMATMPDDPVGSYDPAAGYFHWWPKQGTVEWLEYTWKEPVTTGSVDLYWYDDTGHGGCRIPDADKGGNDGAQA